MVDAQFKVQISVFTWIYSHAHKILESKMPARFFIVNNQSWNITWTCSRIIEVEIKRFSTQDCKPQHGINRNCIEFFMVLIALPPSNTCTYIKWENFFGVKNMTLVPEPDAFFNFNLTSAEYGNRSFWYGIIYTIPYGGAPVCSNDCYISTLSK